MLAPFLEQIGGGLGETGPVAAATGIESPKMPSPAWNLCNHIPLTPLSSNTPEGWNFAHHRAETVSSVSEDIAPQSLDNDYFNDLDPETIASLACDWSSNFSPTSSEFGQSKKVTAIVKEEIDSAKPVSIKKGKDSSHSLLEDFYMASKFCDIILPSGLAPPTTAKSTITSDPFFREPAAQEPHQTIFSDAPPVPYTPSSKTSAQEEPSSEGRPSHATLQQCQDSFAQIEDIFLELAHILRWPALQIKKWFFLNMKGSRHTSEWNLQQAYFPKHREEELEHCGLEDGLDTYSYSFCVFFVENITDKDCWPSF